MSKYIDADEFVKIKREWYCEQCLKRKGMKRGKLQFVYEIGGAPCRACDVDDMISDIEDFPAADVEPKRKWISVNSDKPKEYGKYFVLRHSQGRPIVEIMYYGIPEYLKDRYFYYYDSEWGDVVVGDVTHWLPLSALPELPKGEDHEIL